MNAPVYVYITRYALTEGIIRAELIERREYGSSVRNSEWFNNVANIPNKDIHDTLEAARVEAQNIAAKKLKALDKQREKIARMSFDTVKEWK